MSTAKCSELYSCMSNKNKKLYQDYNIDITKLFTTISFAEKGSISDQWWYYYVDNSQKILYVL